MKKHKYTYSVLYKLPGDTGIHFMSINTDVNTISDISSLMEQQIRNGNISPNAIFVSMNLSDFNP